MKRRNARSVSIKRLLVAILMTVALVFSLFQGCASSQQDTDSIDVDLSNSQTQSGETSDMLTSWLVGSLISPGFLMSSSMPALSSVTVDVDSVATVAQADVKTTDNELIDPEVGDDIKIEITNIDEEDFVAPDTSGDGIDVLIYHTHTCEAYTQTADAKYVPSGDWRTTDFSQSVVKVGDELAKELKSLGLNVIHDKTNHEPPKLGTAYERSLTTMESYEEKYGDIPVFIDLHRDAYELESGKADCVEVDGKSLAKVMFVVGTGEGKTGNGFDIRPDWKSNYSLAKSVTSKLQKINPKLARDVRVKTGRYNQHLSSASMLIEVGHNYNTLQQSLNTVPYLAKCIAESLK